MGWKKDGCLNFKIQLLHFVQKKPISTMQKLRNELGPQQPSKYIEQETFGLAYQLWPISTKLPSTSIQNLIIQSKQFSCQYEGIFIPSEMWGRLSRSNVKQTEYHKNEKTF